MIYGDPEIIRVDGNLYAYVRTQNEYTGNVSGAFRRIYTDGNYGWYFKADGKNQYYNDAVNRFLASEIENKEIRDFYKKYSSQIGINR